jgi:hypothetical protein
MLGVAKQPHQNALGCQGVKVKTDISHMTELCCGLRALLAPMTQSCPFLSDRRVGPSKVNAINRVVVVVIVFEPRARLLLLL